MTPTQPNPTQPNPALLSVVSPLPHTSRAAIPIPTSQIQSSPTASNHTSPLRTPSHLGHPPTPTATATATATMKLVFAVALLALLCALQLSPAAGSMPVSYARALREEQHKQQLIERLQGADEEVLATGSQTESQSESESRTAARSQAQTKSARPNPTPSTIPALIRRRAVATLAAVGSGSATASGTVTFSCIENDCASGTVKVEYTFSNIPVGKHSFNLYEYANPTGDGSASGRYFLTAPPSRSCASAPPATANPGDLGEIDVKEANSIVSGSFTKTGIFLTGDKSIVGRGVGLDAAPCDATSDGKDRPKVVVGAVGITKPTSAFPSPAASGVAPSSVKGGFCSLSPIASSGLAGTANVNLVAGTKGSLQIVASVTAPAAAPAALFAQVYTYGDLSDVTTGSSLGPVNANNIGDNAQLTKDGNTYSLSATYAGIDLSGSSSILGRALVIYSKDAQSNAVVHAACPIALTGPIPETVCKNTAAANFNQALPCIMAAKLASKDTKTTIDIPDGPSFEVPAGSLKVDELFIEVYEVTQDFGSPSAGSFKNIDIASTIDFQPPGDHFNPNNLPTVTFPPLATKGTQQVGLISQDGKTWDVLPGLVYDEVKGLTGSVPHFSYVANGLADKKDSDDAMSARSGLGLTFALASLVLLVLNFIN